MGSAAGDRGFFLLRNQLCAISLSLGGPRCSRLHSFGCSSNWAGSVSSTWPKWVDWMRPITMRRWKKTPKWFGGCCKNSRTSYKNNSNAPECSTHSSDIEIGTDHKRHKKSSNANVIGNSSCNLNLCTGVYSSLKAPERIHFKKEINCSFTCSIPLSYSRSLFSSLP